ncbi:hypothetical protein BpOF4_21759 (plasmid) [Alkalihalophilus pseudofirmus OF4]|uniref:Uncharacterized protein n=1 Tax=Alkalihalophilus pseudofirmus (strain ATCC BAA-2126 / JCM 17055 / OF4) TaxID=398511 RepID=D3G1X1_ALKPO|nr:MULTISPECIES: hypothetical protein [Alkalihalophilus]ADC52347.1 hypothetical protein BpOF4_21759 [Alkalihalophilus pseudofirmus OF4]MED1602973.1 hypothetical protein [Alkalihalophilus marmarensis]
MDDKVNFGDVPAGKSISYQQLLYYLEQGREIEFTYKGKEYLISNSSEGRAIWSGQTLVSNSSSDDSISLIQSTKIEGIPLIDLFKQGLIKITTVF